MMRREKTEEREAFELKSKHSLEKEELQQKIVQIEQRQEGERSIARERNERRAACRHVREGQVHQLQRREPAALLQMLQHSLSAEVNVRTGAERQLAEVAASLGG